ERPDDERAPDGGPDERWPDRDDGRAHPASAEPAEEKEAEAAAARADDDHARRWGGHGSDDRVHHAAPPSAGVGRVRGERRDGAGGAGRNRYGDDRGRHRSAWSTGDRRAGRTALTETVGSSRPQRWGWRRVDRPLRGVGVRTAHPAPWGAGVMPTGTARGPRDPSR